MSVIRPIVPLLCSGFRSPVRTLPHVILVFEIDYMLLCDSMRTDIFLLFGGGGVGGRGVFARAELVLAPLVVFVLAVLRRFLCCSLLCSCDCKFQCCVCHSTFLVSSPCGVTGRLSFVIVAIMKICLYNFDPLKPHFCIVNRFTGVYIIFLILLRNIDCGYSLESLHWGGSNDYPQSMFWAGIWKISELIIWKFSFFFVVKFSIYLNRRVFVMIFWMTSLIVLRGRWWLCLHRIAWCNFICSYVYISQ